MAPSQHVSRRQALVTGCAGFVGSHLSERLVAEGWEVLGVDCFRDYYAREVKEANVAPLRSRGGFELRELDLACDDLAGLTEGVEAVFHLAGRPGARDAPPPECHRDNIVATARLLEEAARRPPRRFVHASSSSVHGGSSVYARSKRRGEILAARARAETGLPVVGLRYFSLYGPRQRPDMAFSRFLAAGLSGRPLPILGDGTQERDFTFVSDAVDATLLAADRGRPGRVYDIGAGRPVALTRAISLISELLELPVATSPGPAHPDDPARTAADTGPAGRELGFAARVGLSEGLARQAEWAIGLESPARVAA